jgi:hypothetical protein
MPSNQLDQFTLPIRLNAREKLHVKIINATSRMYQSAKVVSIIGSYTLPTANDTVRPPIGPTRGSAGARHYHVGLELR